MKALVFTIVTRNRLHLARVLMQSVAAAFPDAERHVLVIDPAEGFFDPLAEPFTITFGHDLQLPDFISHAFVNDALSMCCLLKPAFALRLLERSDAEMMIYADSDMYCYSRPNSLMEKLRETSVLLTPHALAPLGDGASRTDGDLMRSGAFNAGFFAFHRGARTSSFLEWWLAVMSRERRLDAGFCHDQQWLSLAAVYFPWIVAWRDPGYNLAYWNLAQRPLGRDAQGGLTAAGHPLSFFHFSFFNAATPELLANRPPLVVPTKDELLRDLLRDYADRLTAAEAAVCLRWPYAYGFFTDGAPVTNLHRDYYLQRAWDDPAHSGSPFDPAFTTRNNRGLKSVYAVNQPVARWGRRLRHWLRQSP